MLNRPDYIWIIGCFDAYGKMHHQLVKLGDTSTSHGGEWPHVHHKRWRFHIGKWDVNYLNPADHKCDRDEIEQIYAVAKKYFEEPEWAKEPPEIKSFVDVSGKTYKSTAKKRYVELSWQIVEETASSDSNYGWNRGRRWETKDCRKIKYV